MNNFEISENDNKIVIKIDEIKTEIITKYKEKYQIIDEIKNILFTEDNLKINFYEFEYLMKKSGGEAFIGIGHKIGKNSAYEVLSEAIKEISINGVDIKKSKGLLINVIANENYPFIEFDKAFELFLGELIENEETDIIQGENYNESFADGEIKVMIIVI